MISVAKCLGHAETKGTASFALARRPFFQAARCRATLISSSVRCDAIFYRALAFRCARSSRIMFCGTISSSARCIALPKNHPPCYADAKDVKPPLREIE